MTTTTEKPVPAWRVPWRLGGTKDDAEHNEFLSFDLVNGGMLHELIEAAYEAETVDEAQQRRFEVVDDLMIALDLVGWAVVSKTDNGLRFPMASSHPLAPAWANVSPPVTGDTIVKLLPKSSGPKRPTSPTVRQVLDNMEPAERQTFVLDFLDHMVESGMIDASKLADFKPPWTNKS
jgi:hypothetical protein